jgi:osmotically inducible protein OsmC
MATFARHVDVDWNGGLLDGSGTAKAGSGAFSVPVTFPSRIAEKADGKTTPEEFMAAAHAVCYAMVLTNTIGKQGGQASRVRVTATVTADKSDAGIKVTSSHLKAVVEGLTGIAAGGIQELATGAEKGCPISNAIRGSVAITVEAQAV